MANPSTEGGSGAGTEVLRRGWVDGMTNSEATLLTGVANHIYTVLSVIFCERADAAETFSLYVDADLAGGDIYLLRLVPLAEAGTFVFNDKFVITETDKLHAILANPGEVDIWVSYIDQEFAA